MYQLMLMKFSLRLQELISHHVFYFIPLLIWFACWVPEGGEWEELVSGLWFYQCTREEVWSGWNSPSHRDPGEWWTGCFQKQNLWHMGIDWRGTNQTKKLHFSKTLVTNSRARRHFAEWEHSPLVAKPHPLHPALCPTRLGHCQNLRTKGICSAQPNAARTVGYRGEKIKGAHLTQNLYKIFLHLTPGVEVYKSCSLFTRKGTQDLGVVIM